MDRWVRARVLARLLLDKQLEVGRHEVDASLQSHLLAYEARFENGLVPVVCRLEERIDRLLYVFHLFPCLQVERCLLVEVLAGAVFEGFLSEVRPERHRPVVVLALVDDVVERASGKVSDEDGLRVGRLFQTLEGVDERRMAIGREASGQRTDVDEKIGLHDNLPHLARLLALLGSHVDEVHLRSRLQQVGEVLQARLAAVHLEHFLISVLCRLHRYHVAFHGTHNAPHTSAVDVSYGGLRLARHGYVPDELGRNVGVEHLGDEHRQRATVVEQLLALEWGGAVGVVSHLLDVEIIVHPDAFQLAEHVDLGKERPDGVGRSGQSSGACEHQCLVHQLVERGGFHLRRRGDVGHAMEELGGGDV